MEIVLAKEEVASSTLVFRSNTVLCEEANLQQAPIFVSPLRSACSNRPEEEIRDRA